jgi:hypothetical protein
MVSWGSNGALRRRHRQISIVTFWGREFVRLWEVTTAISLRAAVARPRALADAADSAHIAAMLHLAKLAVGIRDIPHLATVQAARAERDPPLRHQTRNFPRRAPEVIDGGSIYWVVAGTMLVRQRVRDIIEDQWDDGTRCAALVLDPALVPLLGRPTKAFQGWRYLAAADAPPDRPIGSVAEGEADLPPTLRRELQALGLL